MRAIRRTDYAPRLEMMPLIDVIFLLLTFFIYNLLISVPLEMLPMQFADVSTGLAAGSEKFKTVTLDRRGDFYFGRDKVSNTELDQRLRALAADPARPMLYLVVDAKGDVDRAPLVIKLIELVKEAGVKKVTFVGQPSEAAPTDENKEP